MTLPAGVRRIVCLPGRRVGRDRGRILAGAREGLHEDEEGDADDDDDEDDCGDDDRVIADDDDDHDDDNDVCHKLSQNMILSMVFLAVRTLIRKISVTLCIVVIACTLAGIVVQFIICNALF